MGSGTRVISNLGLTNHTNRVLPTMQLHRSRSLLRHFKVKRSPVCMVLRKTLGTINKPETDTVKESVARFEQTLTELRQNESLKKVREMLRKARQEAIDNNASLIKDVCEKTNFLKETVSNAARSVAAPIVDVTGKVAEHLPDLSETVVVRKLSEAEQKVLESTDAYQYGGFRSRQQRERVMERLVRPEDIAARDNLCPEDINAGTAVVFQSKIADQADQSRITASFKKLYNSRIFFPLHLIGKHYSDLITRYQTSRNVFVHFGRSITNSFFDFFRRIFSETETSGAMREILLRDPAFRIDSHERFMREAAIPSILDALVSGDLSKLHIWCSDAAFRSIKNTIDARAPNGTRLDGRILDMRNVDLASVRLLEDGSPALVYTLSAQQVMPVRSILDNSIVSGAEDAIEHVIYVMAFSIDHPSLSGLAVNNKTITRGWRLVEFVSRDRNVW